MLAVVELITNYGYCWNIGRARKYIRIDIVVDILKRVLDAEHNGKYCIFVILQFYY